MDGKKIITFIIIAIVVLGLLGVGLFAPLPISPPSPDEQIEASAPVLLQETSTPEAFAE